MCFRRKLSFQPNASKKSMTEDVPGWISPMVPYLCFVICIPIPETGAWKMDCLRLQKKWEQWTAKAFNSIVIKRFSFCLCIVAITWATLVFQSSTVYLQLFNDIHPAQWSLSGSKTHCMGCCMSTNDFHSLFSENLTNLIHDNKPKN